MINKFGAVCAACGQSVAPGAGDTNKVGERWVTRHAPACPPRPPAASLPRYWPPVAQHSYDPLSYATGYDYDEEFYLSYGMTQADFRDAVNPDEGDKG